ncbi:hypothetical protein TRFO_21511 [Tritrichomonas foetus]|uniref:Uncharacterized protein n=1 Tax=Tritrichomonas foetus TaxID=1144522 RepID=A0A1J4KEV2_9EUKA|nr:hypothetical protein TRFO_21511 [Tritrichomonas foetus]|eukprot:OHT09554.1 hypothetical protein TRFO_21511 [Tritrichomonas foetus]
MWATYERQDSLIDCDIEKLFLSELLNAFLETFHRIYSIFFKFIFLMLILWAVVFALSASKEYIDDTFIFTIDTSAGTARIDGLTKYVDEIIIPDTIVVDGNTYLVNSIQYINQTKKITLGKNINLLKTKCFDGNLEELIGIPNSYVSVNSYDTFQNAGKLERAILYLESSLQSNIFIRCTNLVNLEIHYKGDIDANNAYDHPSFGLTGVNLKFLRLYVEGKYVQNTDRLFFDTNPQVNFLEEFIIECTDTFATSKPLFSYNYKPNVAYAFQIKAKSITLCKDALSSADFHSIDLIADTIDIPTDFAVNTENLAGFYTSSEVQLPSTLELFKHENLCYYYVTSDFEISDTVLPVSIYVSGTVNIASLKNDFKLGRLMLLNDTKVTNSSSIQIGEVDIHGTSTIAAS